MNKTQITNKKKLFLDELTKLRGMITTASVNTGVAPNTIRNWRKSDKKFDEDVLTVLEMEGDKVENKLINHIDNDDVGACIFYCKTKLKHRGFTERDVREDDEDTPTVKRGRKKNTDDPILLLDEKIEYFTAMMKDQGIYSAKFDPMIRLTAQTAIKYDATFLKTLAPDYTPIIVQKSREGNERQITNAIETLLHQLGEQLQAQLRALGLNADSKQKIESGTDGLSDFLQKFGNEDEE